MNLGSGVYDPEAIGLVQSLSHPGGNITGLSTSVPLPGGMVGKDVEILRELVPGASKIALLVNPNSPTHRVILANEVSGIGRSLGVALPIVEATTADELDTAFASAVAQQADAMIVFDDNITNQEAPRVTPGFTSVGGVSASTQQCFAAARLLIGGAGRFAFSGSPATLDLFLTTPVVLRQSYGQLRGYVSSQCQWSFA